MTVTEPELEPRPGRVSGDASRRRRAIDALAAPGRSGAVLALLAWPLWVVCFVLLFGSLGPKPSEPPTTQEIRDAYLAAGAPIWAFAVASLFATIALASAPIALGLALNRGAERRALGRILVASGAVTLVLQLWNILSFLAFLLSEPGAQPGWSAILNEGTPGNTIVNAVAWSLSALAAPLAGFALWRARMLSRAGLIVAIIGAVLLILILVFQFGQPMSPSILFFVLGIALLRRRK